MEGQSPLTKTYMYLALLLLFFSFAINPLYAAIDAGVKNNARLQAQEITGIINLMKTSSSRNLEYEINLVANCRLEINNRFVTFTVNPDTKAVNATLAIIQSDVSVDSKTIDCKNQRSLKLRKDGSWIKIN